MAKDIDESFVRQYEAEVHEAYQRRGSKLRNTVRRKNNVVGESTTFQKIGKGVAGKKTRHGKVPVMNVDHEPVTCILEDWYGGDWIDKLDTNKIKHDERSALVNAGVWALGRKTDDLIIENGLEQATQTLPADAAKLTLPKIDGAIETLGANDVPMDDGMLTGVVGWKEWTQLMSIDQFSNADYVPSNELPFAGRGMFAKWWYGAMWFPHSGLPLVGNNRSNFMYHLTSVGHASGNEIETDITWHGDYAAWFVDNMMSQGAVMVDVLGVYEILIDQTV